MSFFILRTVDISDFGVFSISFGVFVTSIAIGRALVGQPVAVRLSDDKAPQRTERAASSWSFSLFLGTGLGLLSVIAGFIVSGDLRLSLISLGSALPFLLLQDARRYSYFALAKPERAFASDLIWAVGQIVAVASIFLWTEQAVWMFIAAWAGTGALAGLVPLVIERGFAQIRNARGWLQESRDLGFRFLLESVLQTGAVQVVLVAVAAIAGFDEVGSLSGARTLFGPMTILLLGAELFGISEGARLVSQSQALSSFIRSIAIALVAVPLASTAAIWWLPSDLIAVVVGDNWADVRPLVPLIGLLVAFQGLAWAYRIGLRSIADAASSLRAQVLTGPAILCGGIVGAAAEGALGAAIGLVIAHALSAVWFYRGFSASLQSTTGPLTADEVHA